MTPAQEPEDMMDQVATGSPLPLYLVSYSSGNPRSWPYSCTDPGRRIDGLDGVVVGGELAAEIAVRGCWRSGMG